MSGLAHQMRPYPLLDSKAVPPQAGRELPDALGDVAQGANQLQRDYVGPGGVPGIERQLIRKQVQPDIPIRQFDSSNSVYKELWDGGCLDQPRHGRNNPAHDVLPLFHAGKSYSVSSRGNSYNLCGTRVPNRNYSKVPNGSRSAASLTTRGCDFGLWKSWKLRTSPIDAGKSGVAAPCR